MLIERRACTRPSRHRGMVARGWQYQTSGLNAAGLPYTIGFSYAEDGNYNAAAGSSTLTIMDQDGPLVFSLQRYGYHWMPTTVVLTFNQALDATTAQDPQDYRIIGPAGRTIRVKEAVYDPAANTVTLHPARRIDIHYRYKLIVDGTAPGGLTNTQGQLLDGTDSGEPGSDYSPRSLATWCRSASAKTTRRAKATMQAVEANPKPAASHATSHKAGLLARTLSSRR